MVSVARMIVHCISRGERTDVVRVGVPRPTSLAFAGPDLARLYVTSASDRLTAAQLGAAPDSGRLLTFVPRVPGQPSAGVGA